MPETCGICGRTGPDVDSIEHEDWCPWRQDTLDEILKEMEEEQEDEEDE